MMEKVFIFSNESMEIKLLHIETMNLNKYKINYEKQAFEYSNNDYYYINEYFSAQSFKLSYIGRAVALDIFICPNASSCLDFRYDLFFMLNLIK